MTALSQDVLADLKATVADLQRRLQSSLAERDQAIVQQAATGLENARLSTELRAAQDRQTGSAEILRAIANAPGDAERSLHQIAETTARLFDAPSVTLHIAEGNDWGPTIRVGDSSKRIGTAVSAAQLRIGGHNLPGTVLLQNRQIHIPDIDNVDPDIADWPGLPPARAAGTCAIAGTPLRREDKAIGVLIVYRDRPVPFTADELALQQSFADQAVIAIENARLFNETKEALERQTATAEILKVIASSPSDVQPVFEAIATSAKRLIGGFSAAVFRFVDDVGHLAAFTPTRPAADEVWKASFPRRLSDFPPFEWVRGGEAAQIPDIEASPDVRDLGRLRGFRSVLVTPLMSNGIPIGMVSVTRLEPGSFADHHVQLLQTFADQAVIAIENVRLFDEVEARTEDLRESLQQQTATADVLKVISRSAFDLDTVLRTLVESAATLCEAERGLIFLRQENQLRVAANYGFSPELEAFARANPLPIDGRSTTARAAASGVAVQAVDLLADETQGELALQYQRLGGHRTNLGVPLRREGETIGVFTLTRQEVRPFTEKQIELVSTFADQAVIAISNVRLFEEVQARTEDLRESLQQQTATADVLKVISRSAFDLQTVLDTLTESAAR